MITKQSFLLYLISMATLLLGCTVDFVLRDAGTDAGSDADSEPCGE